MNLWFIFNIGKSVNWILKQLFQYLLSRKTAGGKKRAKFFAIIKFRGKKDGWQFFHMANSGIILFHVTKIMDS